jgi:hypothetical protein
MRFEDLDKKIKEAADQHHPAYDEKAWQKMEKLLNEHLPQPKDDRRRMGFLLLFFLLVGGGSFLLISKPWNKKTVIANQVAGGNNNQVESNKEGIKKNEVELNPEKTKEASDKETGDEKTSNQKEIVANNQVKTANNNNDRIKESEGKFNGNQRSKTTSQSQFIKNGKTVKNSAVLPVIIPKSINDPRRDKNDRTVSGNDKEKQNADTEKKIYPDFSQQEKKDETKIINENVVKAEDKNEVTKTTGEEVKAEPKKSPKKSTSAKSKNGISFSVSAGPDVSKAGGSKTGKTTLVYGAGVGYTRNRFTLRTGVYVAKKIYWANPDDYKLSRALPPTVKFEGADANCDVLEIPVKLDYSFGFRNKSNWFAGAGLSSYLMKREKYVYFYKTSTSPYPSSYPYNIKNENKHYFSVLNLSGGYTRQLNNTFSISAEPYVEIPLTGIGAGKVHLNSSGVLFTVGVRPFRR